LSAGNWYDLLGALLAATVVRGMTVFLTALAVTVLARRWSSEARHLVWLGVIASFVLIPLAWLLLPSIRIGVVIRAAQAAPVRLAAAPLLCAGEYARLVGPAPVAAALARSASSALSIAGMISFCLSCVWIAGALILAARPALGMRRLLRLAAKAGWDERLQVTGDELARRLAIRGRIPVLLSPMCHIPFAFGILRPRIVLPLSAAKWSAGRLRSALTHELVHILRRDLAVQTAAYAVCVLFWFVPPLWLAYAAMLREAETCCDQQVINRGFRGTEYAQDIVELARSCDGRIMLPSISSVIGRKSMLNERIRRILNLKAGRRPFGTRQALRVLVICLACVVPILALSAQVRPLLLHPSDPLFGTWVNAAYEGNVRAVAAKMVLFADGSELDYRTVSDSEPFYIGNLMFESVWIDAEGDHWYKVLWTGDDYPLPLDKPRFQARLLMKVSAAGSMLEMIFGDEEHYPRDLKDSSFMGTPLQYRQP
jgi:beta-lactamase regulating signal transducer with metallopeptidase domain